MNSQDLLACQVGGALAWEQKLEPNQSVLIEGSSNDDPYEAAAPSLIIYR